MRTLIVSGENVISNGFNDTYTYRFPVGAVNFKNDQVAVSSINMYYSWFNITSATTGSGYNNNVFQYQWYEDIAPPSTRIVTIPDGFYTIADLNAYLQSQMVANGDYLVNSVGDNVYYLEFVENPSKYAVQLNSYPIPDVLPAGWTNPSGFVLPIAAITPQIVVLSTNNFKDIVGFNAGTYPSPTQATNYSKISDFTPQVTPVSSLVLSCTLLNNRYAIPSTLLYSFSPAGVSFGSLVSIQPPEMSFVDIQEGAYTDFTIQFRDQALQRVAINDSNLVVMLTIRDKKEVVLA
jgi:hypothetical protein